MGQEVEGGSVAERRREMVTVATPMMVRIALLAVSRDLIAIALGVIAVERRDVRQLDARRWLHGMCDRPAGEREENRHAGEEGDEPMHSGFP